MLVGKVKFDKSSEVFRFAESEVCPYGASYGNINNSHNFLRSKKLHCGVATTSLIKDKLHFYEVKTSP